MTPDELAESCANAMWAKDAASKWIGMERVSTRAGRAEIALEITEKHTNGHGTCHGGVIFALADSAFAFACNSRNQATVSQHNIITYISPARIDDRLSAVASETSLTGRNGIYDVRVTNQNNDLIAEFRGFSRAINARVIPKETP